SKVSKDTTDVAKITAFDRNLNKIDVSIDPNEVNLSVKVEDYSKKVKVKMKSVGSLSNGQEVKDIKLDDNEVEIYGNKDDLDDIDEITARINLDGVSDTTEKKVDFQVPDKVTKVSPKDTTAKITVK
ncbi:hypothetical protein BUZ72_12470, partial [Staphylococcus saprophyticus]